MKTRAGRTWIAEHLRQRRETLPDHITVRRAAEMAGYYAPNMMSYIELGANEIVFAKYIENVAKTYRVCLRHLKLCWMVAHLADQGVDMDLIHEVFKREDLWKCRPKAEDVCLNGLDLLKHLAKTAPKK